MTGPVNTADVHGARTDARAREAGARVEAMPTLPPSNDFLWEETVAPGGYTSRRIARGTRLTLTDLGGDACASLLVFNAEYPVERLNVADTAKVQWNAYLTQGKLLLSDMGRVMMSIVGDNSAGHDLFCGAANADIHARKYGEGGNHGPCPSARDRFLVALGKWGLGRKDVHPCINLFKPVRIDGNGCTVPDIGPFPPGQAIQLRAEMDLLIVIANCPHVLDDRTAYSVTSLGITAKPGPMTPANDPIRLATPEGERAFLNTEDYYRR
jgi:uncharacterized protein